MFSHGLIDIVAAVDLHRLRGNGGTFVCLDCHPGSLTVFSAPTCAACHQARDAVFMAAHNEAFGTVCVNCHDGVDTYGKSFDPCQRDWRTPRA